MLQVDSHIFTGTHFLMTAKLSLGNWFRFAWVLQSSVALCIGSSTQSLKPFIVHTLDKNLRETTCKQLDKFLNQTSQHRL